MDLNFGQTDAGVEILVKASPRSRKNEIRGVIDGALKVCVTAVAEKGKANSAIVKLLAKELKIAKSQIRLVSGSTSSRKKFLFVDVELPKLKQQLRRLLER